MRIDNAMQPYRKGMLLEAEMLNGDFSLDRFWLAQVCGRYSGGIINGMTVTARQCGLLLNPGLFQWEGRLGWLQKAMPLADPPAGQFLFLCVTPAGDDGWDLAWEADPGSAMVLCRAKVLDMGGLRDSFCLTAQGKPDLENWLTYLRGVNYIQLEYAMAASRSARPSLLPQVQRLLAPFAKDDHMRLWLLNGSLPIMDYYNTAAWQDALDKLTASFSGGNAAPPSVQERKSIFGK